MSPLSSSPRPDPPRPWLRLLAWAAVTAALGGVFLSYLQPELIVDLGNRLWSCF